MHSSLFFVFRELSRNNHPARNLVPCLLASFSALRQQLYSDAVRLLPHLENAKKFCAGRLFFPSSPISLLLTAFFLSIFGTASMAQEISWTIEQTQRTGSDNTLEIQINKEKTRIVSERETLFIDYAEMLIYRLDRASGQCRVFRFNDTTALQSDTAEPDRQISAEISSLLAEFSLKESNERRWIKDCDCRKKIVVLGVGMLGFRTVAPIRLERYGQSFSEAAAEYWVCEDLDIWPALQRAIQKRQQAFSVSPLLKRVDPLGIIEHLGGFPMQSRVKSGGQSIESVLVSSPEPGAVSLQKPGACRGVTPE